MRVYLMLGGLPKKAAWSPRTRPSVSGAGPLPSHPARGGNAAAGPRPRRRRPLLCRAPHRLLQALPSFK